jgi:hypothetical protein
LIEKESDVLTKETRVLRINDINDGRTVVGVVVDIVGCDQNVVASDIGTTERGHVGRQSCRWSTDR